MRFQYQNVCLESIGYTLPDECVTSAEIEGRLAPLYQRLRLPEGRLELMTGIRERRLWAPGTLPGDKSVETAEKAIRQAGVDKRAIGALVHGSVSRDYIEPATACGVHERLGLEADCMIYDVSNACLGLLNGAVQVANMIELGQIRAGVVVGTENSRALLETTIRTLNHDTTLTRNQIKPAFASLTIGSASASLVLVDRKLSRTGNRFLGGVARTNTAFCHLCRGVESLGVWNPKTQDPQCSILNADLSHRPQPVGLAVDSASDELQSTPLAPRPSPLNPQLMETDSETLMREGIRTAEAAFGEFLDTLGCSRGGIQKTFCHQVGRAHQKLLLDTLGLDPAIDFTTFETLGNTGAAALPVTAAIGIESGHLAAGDRVALLGIGSGINVVMLGFDWQQALAGTNV